MNMKLFWTVVIGYFVATAIDKMVGITDSLSGFSLFGGGPPAATQ
jgi:hypothetical protein